MSLLKILSAHRYAVLGIAIILGFVVYISATNIANAGGGTQQCITQIGGLDPDDFVDDDGTSALAFTIHYQNGASQNVSYTDTTIDVVPNDDLRDDTGGYGGGPSVAALLRDDNVDASSNQSRSLS